MSTLTQALPDVAGVNTTSNGITTKLCMTMDERPDTPPNVRKWRKSNYSLPGQRVIYPGQIEDVKKINADIYKVYGDNGVHGSDHVENVWRQPGGETDCARAKYAKTEANYHSSIKEPLGKSYNRGHVLPEAVKNPEYRFGIGSATSESAKGLLYPHIEVDDSQFKEQYIKSHSSYDPGEQRSRKYKWNIDPKTFSFGLTGGCLPYNGVSSGVHAILQGKGEEGEELSQISSKKQEDYKALGDILGRVKNLGFGTRNLPEDYVYGTASIRRGDDDWDARQCIQGGYTWLEQQPDQDLGKSITPGFRNITAESRAFGTPTIRSDIPPYAKKSLADNQNYGDDVNAAQLLNPSEFASFGVDDDEFVKTRSQDEIKSIFEAIGYKFSSTEFETIYNMCADNNGKSTLLGFRDAMNTFNYQKEKKDSLDKLMTSV